MRSLSLHFYIQVPIVSDSDCQDAMTSLTIKKSMLCAGGEGAGSCKVCFLLILQLLMSDFRETAAVL